MGSRLLLLVFFALLSGCANLVQEADEMAAPSGLRRAEVQGGRFLLTTYARVSDKNQPFNVYIEGDGFAWVSRWEPSIDPTPRQALALRLASQDPAPNVLYIARPCQFTPREANPTCRTAYWTDRRFAREVIDAMNEALTRKVGRRDQADLHLIGYSGGGAVAVLMAAERKDVATIRTVAGNLDHTELNRLHDVSPMPASLNALDVAAKVAAIPQLHFSGSRDEVVFPVIARRFQEAAGGSCVAVRLLEGATHEQGWVERWPTLLAEKPACRQ